MSLGLHESRTRRRRRARWAVAKWVIALGLIVGAGVYAYDRGNEIARSQVTDLEREIAVLNQRISDLETENARLRADQIVARQRLEEAKALYARDVPRGQLAALLGQLREKLDAGVDRERLEFLIASAANPRNCDEQPVTKRFLVRTPLYQGANDLVSFADGAITVTATGEAATDADGRVEAWFDPAKPITLQLTRIGGEAVQETGKLPLHASLVAGGNEYRFTAVEGPQGFVQVTGDRCDYP
jgi:cell division protein FtsB